MTEQSSKQSTDRPSRRSRTAGGRLTYVPVFNDGAWLYGALVGAYRANGAAFPAAWLFPGQRRRVRTSPSGITEQFLPDVMEVLSPNLETDRVAQLRRGSLFGFYELGLPRPIAGRWRDRLLGGQETSGTHPIRALHGFSSAINGCVRWCPECCRNDEAKGRIPVWLTLHQIPYVQHCLEHGEQLVHRCAECKTVLEPGWKRRLPLDPCPACGGLVFEGEATVAPPGYTALLQLVRALVDGSINLRGDWWLSVCKRVVDFASKDRLAGLDTAYRSRWGATGAELTTGRGALNWASFEAAASDTSMFVRLVLTDVLLDSGLMVIADLAGGWTPDAATHGTSRNEPMQDLLALLERFELNPSLAEDLASGMPFKALWQKHRMSNRRLYLCLSEASDEVRELIQRHRPPMKAR